MKTAPVNWVALASIGSASVLAVIATPWFWVPLAAFVLTCLFAPFFPGWGFFMQSVSRGPGTRPEVTLTFDDGPDPATTPALLELLARTGTKACFFVTGMAALAHPDLIQAIAGAGHEIGNHSWSHDPFLMLRGMRQLAWEVDRGQEILAEQGIQTAWFRPPVGITNPRLARVLAQRNLTCVNFSCRGNDAGNRRITGLADRILAKVRPGDIILLHDRMPASPHTVEAWLDEVQKVLAGLDQRNLKPVLLSKLLES